MKNLKKPLLILLVLALFTACILTLVGCGSGSGELTGIALSSKSTHKKVYVQGQELDLSGGILTTVIGDQEASLPFTADGVTVTGYDPNTIGKQTLTVTYMGKTTTFEVVVVARTVAESYEKDYFVGEKFNALKGKIKITRNNGTSFTVAMNSSMVSVKSFSTEKAGTTTVVLNYTGEDGSSYDCSFDVTVHAIGSASIKYPFKTEYLSHEDSFDPAGGYITVTAAAPSSLTKSIPINTSMISEFNPKLATSANLEDPLPQVVKITFGTLSYEFPITILYSGLYVVNDAAELLKDIDWTSEGQLFDDNQATLAINAIKAYFKLGDYKSLVDEETLHTVLRPAVIALYTRYLNESVSFQDAFIITTEGTIDLTAVSPEAVATAIERISNKDDIFNQYADLATQIRDEFGTFKIVEGGKTVNQYLLTHSVADVDGVVSIFNFMLELHNYLKDVPADWDLGTLMTYADDITTAATMMMTSQYAKAAYASLFFTVSDWRGGDYLDIVYSYYYNIKVGGQEIIVNNMWGKIPAPGMLAEWYVAFSAAVREEQMLEYYGTSAYLYDVSGFFYYYNQLIEITEKLFAEGDELSLNIYELVGCEDAFNSMLKYAPCGYIYQLGEAINYERVMKVWTIYVDIIDQILKSTDGDFSLFGDKIETLTKELFALSPAELHTFLSSVNFLYGNSGGTVFVLDYAQSPLNMLAYALAIHYESVLPATVAPLFRGMLVAIESLSHVGIRKDAFDSFITCMEEINTLYGGLGSDQAEFNKYFEDIYANLNVLYMNVKNDTAVDLGGMGDSFTEFNSLCDSFDKILSLIQTSEDQATVQKLIPLAVAIYEKLNQMYESIICSGNVTAINALYTKLYTLGEVSYTLDKRFFGVREIVVTLLLSSGVTDAEGNSMVLWEVFADASTSVKTFIVEALPLMLAQYESRLWNGDLYGLIESFRALVPEDQITVYLLGINLLYYEAVEENVVAMLTEANNVDGAVYSMLQLEICYVLYANDSSIDNLTALQGAAANVKDIIAKLGTDKADQENAKEYLEPLYEEYLEFVNQLG